jgi:hypothetical protein
VVLGGDARERVGLIAPTLEVARGDLAENAGEAAVDIGFLAHIRCLEQVAPDLGSRRRRHLLDADREHDASGPGSDRRETLMHGGRAGGTGVLHPAGAFEAQVRRRLKHQCGGKVLGRKAGIEMPEHDLIDIAGADPGIGEGLACNSNDQALDGFTLEPPKGCVRPADDASRHGSLLSVSSLYVIYGHWSGQLSRNGLTCRTLDVFSYHERPSGASAQHRRALAFAFHPSWA